jgi:hypothetical protein
MSTIADLPASASRQWDETTIGADANGLTATAVWLCDYADVPSFLQVAGGIPAPAGPNSAIRIVPMQFPDFNVSGNSKLYCSSAKAKGKGHNYKIGNAGSYSKARIVCEFKTFPFPIDGSQAFMTVQLDSAGRFLNAPASAFKFASGALPSQDVGLYVAGFTMRVTLHQLQGLNWGLYAGLAGSVNSTTFLGFGTGQVLYKGVSASATTTVGGQTSYSITHELEFSAVDFNMEIRPGSTGPFTLFYADGTTLRYPLADLSRLLS